MVFIYGAVIHTYVQDVLQKRKEEKKQRKQWLFENLQSFRVLPQTDCTERFLPQITCHDKIMYFREPNLDIAQNLSNSNRPATLSMKGSRILP